MPKKDILMPYDFDYEGGKDNAYTFKTINSIIYRVKFKPSGYLFDDYVCSFYAYELVIDLLKILTINYRH